MVGRLMTRLVLLAVLLMTDSLAWAGDKALEKALRKMPSLLPAEEVHRRVDDVLERFGQLVTSYKLPMGYGPIIVEIDYLGNISGNDKFPADIGQYARDALAKTEAFLTFRSLPEAAESKGPAGVVLPQLLREREAPPRPTFRLVGGIVGAEQVVVKEGNRRVDTQFGNGITSANGGTTGDHSRMLTALTIALTLEAPNSLSVMGASARFRIYIEQTENGNGVELYVGGNGFGLGSRLKITQDSSDALYETVGMSLVEVMGNGLKIPYFLCSETFHSDTALEGRVRRDFGRLTNMQLEQELQRFMVVDGLGISRQLGPLQPADRAMLIVEMQHRKLPVDRAGMIELAMQFWRGINYRDGAERMAGIYVGNDFEASQRAEREAIQQAELRVDPTEFGFAAGTSIIVVDLSRIGRPDMLKQISATLRRCSGCSELRWHPQKPLIGINTAMKESEIQYLINSTRFPLEYVWSHVQSPRVLVVPVVGTPQQVAAVSTR